MNFDKLSFILFFLKFRGFMIQFKHTSNISLLFFLTENSLHKRCKQVAGVGALLHRQTVFLAAAGRDGLE